MGFRLAPSELTLDDLEGSKIKTKSEKNIGNAYLVNLLRYRAEIL